MTGAVGVNPLPQVRNGNLMAGFDIDMGLGSYRIVPRMSQTGL
jgi:hypothetical protein